MKKTIAAVLAASAMLTAGGQHANAAVTYERTNTCYIPHFRAIAVAHVKWSRVGTYTMPTAGKLRMLRTNHPQASINGTANATAAHYQGGNRLRYLMGGLPASDQYRAFWPTNYYNSRVGEYHVWLYVSMRDLYTNDWYGCTMDVSDGIGLDS